MLYRGDSIGIVTLTGIPEGVQTFIILNSGYFNDSINASFPSRRKNDTISVQVKKDKKLYEQLMSDCKKDTTKLNYPCFNVIDLETLRPIWGAILRIEPDYGAETDSLGIANFRNMPDGFHKVSAHYIGRLSQLIEMNLRPNEHFIVLFALSSFDIDIQRKGYDGGPLLASSSFRPDDAFYSHKFSIFVKLGDYPLEKATVSLENETAKFERVTDSKGLLTIEDIPNGIFTLKIKYQSGFERDFPILFNNGFFCITEDAKYDEYDGWANYFKIRVGILTVVTTNYK